MRPFDPFPGGLPTADCVDGLPCVVDLGRTTFTG